MCNRGGDTAGLGVCWHNFFEMQNSGGKGMYKTKGTSCTAGSDCVPGARSHYSSFPSDDGFYIFGGQGFDANGNEGLLNDFWRFQIINDQPIYTWIGGSDDNTLDLFSVRDEVDKFSSTVVVGKRQGAATFKGNNLICIFGGYGASENGGTGGIADFYCYGISQNMWKYLGGYDDTQSSMFHRGDDFPGQRYHSNTWSIQNSDGNDYFYLFGGATDNYYQNYAEGLSDFWKYDVTNKQWTLLNKQSTDDETYKYDQLDTQTTFNQDSRPPKTIGSVTFVSGDSLFLFGGTDRGAIEQYYNTLWEYSTSKDMWRYICGGIDKSSVFTGDNQEPRGRKFAVGTVFANSFYLFGGEGKSVSSSILNDVFKFDLVSKNWNFLNFGDSEIDPKVANGVGRYESDAADDELIYPYPRNAMKNVIIGRRMYFFGGFDNAGHYQDSWYMLIEHQCYGLSMSDSNVCNGKGKCTGNNICECEDGYTGDLCEKNTKTDTQGETLVDLSAITPYILIGANVVFVIVVVIIIAVIIISVYVRQTMIKKEKAEEALKMKIRRESMAPKAQTKKDSPKKSKSGKNSPKKSKSNKNSPNKEKKKADFGVARLSFI